MLRIDGQVVEVVARFRGTEVPERVQETWERVLSYQDAMGVVEMVTGDWVAYVIPEEGEGEGVYLMTTQEFEGYNS